MVNQLNLSKSRDPNKSYQYKPLKKMLADNIYQLGSAKQAVNFESSNECFINHIKKTLNFVNDIGTVLESLKEFDLNQLKPSLSISVSVDEGV